MVMPSGVRMDSDWTFMGQTSLSERTKRLFAAGCQAVLHKIKNAPDRTNGFCQGRIAAIIRGDTWNSQHPLCVFAGYQHIPGK